MVHPQLALLVHRLSRRSLPGNDLFELTSVLALRRRPHQPDLFHDGPSIPVHHLPHDLELLLVHPNEPRPLRMFATIMNRPHTNHEQLKLNHERRAGES